VCGRIFILTRPSTHIRESALVGHKHREQTTKTYIEGIVYPIGGRVDRISCNQGLIVVGYTKFSSPREEALAVAYQTRKNILDGKQEASSILRACLVIANDLNKTDTMEWIKSELSGFSDTKKIPSYRRVRCQQRFGDDYFNIAVPSNVHLLSNYLREKEDMHIRVGEEESAVLHTGQISALLNAVIDNCLSFLNGVIAELQYGGIVEYLMEEIRKNTDEKLAKLDAKLTDEAQSLYVNLTSTNPADWNKVGHSCRKILILIADKIFPPRTEQYAMKDNRTIEVSDPLFINRICAFIDQRTSGDERKFLMAEVRYLESYLRQVVEYDQMGEHKPSIEKFHANMMAIHTYLIASEILKHLL
jgi:hypothetical protein